MNEENENRCVACGEIIPEGTQVCYKCLYDALTLKLPNGTSHPSSMPEDEWKEIAKKLWTYICIIDDENETYEELADAIGLTDDELHMYRRLER